MTRIYIDDARSLTAELTDYDVFVASDEPLSEMVAQTSGSASSSDQRAVRAA